MSGAGPTLTTARLMLRRWLPSDVDPFAALNGDPDVMEHFPARLDRVQTEALIERFETHFDEHGYGLWAVEVTDPPDDRADCIGFIGINYTAFAAPFTPAVEVGWRLAKAAWGRGYASEGAREVLRFAFDDLGLDEIVSFTTVDNLRSQAVMQRIGMTHDPADDFDHPNVAPGTPWHRHVLYRLSAAEWRAAVSA